MIAAYVRVSTAKQRDAATIETQKEQIKTYCQYEGITPDTLLWFEDDGESGKIPLENRNGGAALLEAIRSRKVESRLLTYDLSRLARDSEDGIGAGKRITKRGVLVTTVTDRQSYDNSQASRLNLGMRMLMAENEWESIRKRTMDGRKELAPQGYWMGGTVPMGFQTIPDGKRKRLEISTAAIPGQQLTEADVVKEIYKLAVRGKSCQVIADHLNSLGIPTQAPGPGKRTTRIAPHWRPSRIRHLLVNPLFKGELYWGKRSATAERGKRLHLNVNPKEKWVRTEVPAIVDAALWQRANDALQKNQLAIMAHAKNEYLLGAKVILCGVCGRHYIGAAPYYRCIGRHGARHLNGNGGRCESASIRCAQLEALVWGDLEMFIYKPGPVLRQLESQFAEAEKNSQSEKDIAKLEKVLASCAVEDQRNVTHLNQGVLTPEDFRRERERIAKQRAALETELGALRQRSTDVKANARRLQTAGQMLTKMRDQMDRRAITFVERRRVVDLLVRGITVDTTQGRPEVTVAYAFDGNVTRMQKDSSAVSDTCRRSDSAAR